MRECSRVYTEYRELMENSNDSWEAKNKLLNDILGLKEFRKEGEDYET